MTSLGMMNSLRGFWDPVLNRVVMMTSCWLRHLALLSHHSRWIVLRIILVKLVSFAIGKRRVPRGPYPPMMVSPVGLRRAIRVLLRPLVMTVVGCDVPGWGVAPRWSGRSSAGEPGSCPGHESCVMESQYVCGPGWNVLPGGGYEPTDPVGVGSPGSYHEPTGCCGQCTRTAGIRS